MVDTNILVELLPKSCLHMEIFSFFLKNAEKSLSIVAHVVVITLTKFKPEWKTGFRVLAPREACQVVKIFRIWFYDRNISIVLQ